MMRRQNIQAEQQSRHVDLQQVVDAADSSDEDAHHAFWSTQVRISLCVIDSFR